MLSFHDVFVFALYAMVFVAVSLVCYIVMSFVQYLVREYKFFKQFIMMVWNWVARTFDFKALLFISFPAVILFFGILPSDENAPSFTEKQAFLFGVLLGFPVLIKRLSVMQEQAEKSQRQVEIGQKQTRINQYNTANDWLWSNHLGLRMAGIDALFRLAQTYPKEEYRNVMNVFAHFIKHPHRYGVSGIKAGKRKDINAILHTFKKSMQKMMGKEFMKDTEGINLTGADLQEAELWGSDLNGVWLLEANLCGANLRHAQLKGVSLGKANLSGANFMGAGFIRADSKESYLYLAIINGANFFGSNLTQKQIDECVFITNHPSHMQSPLLPHGRKPNYQRMSIRKWESLSRRKFY